MTEKNTLSDTEPPSLSVLYIDDDDIMTELLALQLEEYGITMSAAHTASDGVATYTPQQHILVVIDWNLPDGSGPEIAEKLRAKHADAPIAFLSGGYTDKRLQLARSFNPHACLEKDAIVAQKIADLVKIIAHKNEPQGQAI